MEEPSEPTQADFDAADAEADAPTPTTRREWVTVGIAALLCVAELVWLFGHRAR